MDHVTKAQLSDADYDALDRVLRRTPELLELAKACEDCGWDVSAARQALSEQGEMARKAKAKFFPHKP